MKYCTLKEIRTITKILRVKHKNFKYKMAAGAILENVVFAMS